MAHYIFIQGTHPNAGWQLLEKVEHEDLAEKVFSAFQQRFDGRERGTLAMIEAPNLLEGQALLNGQDAEALRCRFSPGSTPLPWRHDCSSLP